MVFQIQNYLCGKTSDFKRKTNTKRNLSITSQGYFTVVTYITWTLSNCEGAGGISWAGQALLHVGMKKAIFRWQDTVTMCTGTKLLVHIHNMPGNLVVAHEHVARHTLVVTGQTLDHLPGVGERPQLGVGRGRRSRGSGGEGEF